jgi:hypothetical protein
MALANKATNVTKYVAGGTGDNIIPDGFIKSVEKVWIDSYVFSSAATIGTGMIIDIAVVPAGKKVTGIEVYGLAAAQISATSTNAVSIGARYGTTAITNATQFLVAVTLGTVTFNNSPIIATSNIGVECTSSTHTIFLLFTAATPSITGGTITTKVRYT